MKESSNYIQSLIISKLAGLITEEESLYLEQLIREDEAVKREWERLSGQFPKEKLDHYKELDWMDPTLIASLPQRNNVRTLLIRKLAVAASVLVIIGLGAFYLINHKTDQSIAAAAPAAPKDKKVIELKLANGQVINLTQRQDSIRVADVSLSNVNKTLSFSAANTTKKEESVSLNSLTVPIGMDYHVELADGTEVWMNSATSLQFPFAFNGKTREITINGEGYMKVAQDAAKPFLVHTPQGTVQVLGTEFNINSYDSGIVKVSLVQGAVNFKASSGKKVSLKPGMEAVYNGGNDIELQSFDADKVLAWRLGRYYFNQATLEEITAVLPRWFGIEVVMDNPTIGKEQFTGMLNRNRPITAFLGNLKKTTKIDYYFDKDVLHFK
ncbi:FecR family protein [Chitinophaga niastensis]|uniref:FecR family protein n=1 Tax=Chitinophaga niastensis TaxID=536980 RepID=UPI001304EAF4|nr:FecR domain-containing protein [Chitinophaga niastensis]